MGFIRGAGANGGITPLARCATPVGGGGRGEHVRPNEISTSLPTCAYMCIHISNWLSVCLSIPKNCSAIYPPIYLPIYQPTYLLHIIYPPSYVCLYRVKGRVTVNLYTPWWSSYIRETCYAGWWPRERRTRELAIYPDICLPIE